jgi:hypothetical protein
MAEKVIRRLCPPAKRSGSLRILILSVSALLCLAGCSNKEKELRLAVSEEGKSSRQQINAALVALDACVAKTEARKNAFLEESDSATPATDKPKDWSSPAEVVVVLQSNHEEIDRSPGARGVSNQLRAMGSTGISVNGSGWSPVPGGMRRLVFDSVSIKSGANGAKLVWDQPKAEAIQAAAGELGRTFQASRERLKPMAKSDTATLIGPCEAGVEAAKQLSESVKAILDAQAASAGKRKPDERALQTHVGLILKARADIRDALLNFDNALQSFTAEPKR